MTILLFSENRISVWNRDFVLQDHVFLMKSRFFHRQSHFFFFTIANSFLHYEIVFHYNLVFLFHAGNEFNVVWIRPVATRRLRSDYGLIAMVTSWPRLFIAVAWHAMSSVCDVRVCLRCSLWEHFVWACLRSPHRYAWLREWPFVVAWLRENEKNYYVLA